MWNRFITLSILFMRFVIWGLVLKGKARTFNSLYEILPVVYVWSCCPLTFQFSLWDSFQLTPNQTENKTFNSLYEILANETKELTERLYAFNSLYEILNMANEIKTKELYAFNSLYEILPRMTYYTSIFRQLSILFMRFQ